MRKDHSPQNMATLRQISHNQLKRETSLKVGIQGKRLQAGWREDYLRCFSLKTRLPWAYPVRSRCQLSIPGLAYCEPGIVIDVECDNVLAPVSIPLVGGLGQGEGDLESTSYYPRVRGMHICIGCHSLS